MKVAFAQRLRDFNPAAFISWSIISFPVALYPARVKWPDGFSPPLSLNFLEQGGYGRREITS
jgi:hypothetical protein